jgi:hypothetical protein
VPADDITDPGPATTFMHLDASTVLSRKLVELGLYPAVDPLQSTSKGLRAEVIGEKHYQVARTIQHMLQRYKELQDVIAILGLEELADEDKINPVPCLLYRPLEGDEDCEGIGIRGTDASNNSHTKSKACSCSARFSLNQRAPETAKCVHGGWHIIKSHPSRSTATARCRSSSFPPACRSGRGW